jgi:hypothetical protein
VEAARRRASARRGRDEERRMGGLVE